MSENFIRKVFYYKDHYLDFFNKLHPDVKNKFNWTLQLVATVRYVPEKYFKHIVNSTGLYEIRIEYASNVYRIFCFFDKGEILIILNVFLKKTNKTPSNLIKLAEKLKMDYFNEKNQ